MLRVEGEKRKKKKRHDDRRIEAERRLMVDGVEMGFMEN